MIAIVGHERAGMTAAALAKRTLEGVTLPSQEEPKAVTDEIVWLEDVIGVLLSNEALRAEIAREWNNEVAAPESLLVWVVQVVWSEMTNPMPPDRLSLEELASITGSRKTLTDVELALIERPWPLTNALHTLSYITGV